jgi:hypothetical protein
MVQVGLTEVLAALSLATDLGSGFAPEKGLRVCLAGMAVGAQADIRNGELADLFQSTLLLALGCTAFATENAGYFDDDLAFQRAMHRLDVTDPASMNSFGSWAADDRAAMLRARFIEIAPTVGPQATAAACEASRSLGAKLGLRPNSIAALDHVHERWDGHGLPGLYGGDELPLIARVMHLAEQAVIAHGAGGPRAALATVASRAGGHLDPALADLVLSEPEPLIAAVSSADPLTAVVAAEPPPKARDRRDDLDRLAEAFGDLADLKCRFTLGHSRGVASLADAAASLPGWPMTRAAGSAGRRSFTTSDERAFRPERGSVRVRSAPARSTWSACTRTGPSACSSDPRRWSSWLHSRAAITNGWTGPGTTGAWPAPPSPASHGCSPRRTCCMRSASPALTVPRAISTARHGL